MDSRARAKGDSKSEVGEVGGRCAVKVIPGEDISLRHGNNGLGGTVEDEVRVWERQRATVKKTVVLFIYTGWCRLYDVESRRLGGHEPNEPKRGTSHVTKFESG